jgi:hypothetical protein
MRCIVYSSAQPSPQWICGKRSNRAMYSFSKKCIPDIRIIIGPRCFASIALHHCSFLAIPRPIWVHHPLFIPQHCNLQQESTTSEDPSLLTAAFGRLHITRWTRFRHSTAAALPSTLEIKGNSSNTVAPWVLSECQPCNVPPCWYTTDIHGFSDKFAFHGAGGCRRQVEEWVLFLFLSFFLYYYDSYICVFSVFPLFLIPSFLLFLFLFSSIYFIFSYPFYFSLSFLSFYFYFSCFSFISSFLYLFIYFFLFSIFLIFSLSF